MKRGGTKGHRLPTEVHGPPSDVGWQEGSGTVLRADLGLAVWNQLGSPAVKQDVRSFLPFGGRSRGDGSFRLSFPWCTLHISIFRGRGHIARLSDFAGDFEGRTARRAGRQALYYESKRRFDMYQTVRDETDGEQQEDERYRWKGGLWLDHSTLACRTRTGTDLAAIAVEPFAWQLFFQFRAVQCCIATTSHTYKHIFHHGHIHRRRSVLCCISQAPRQQQTRAHLGQIMETNERNCGPTIIPLASYQDPF